MREKIRKLLAALAALLALGLAVLWLRPLPPSGADISVLSPDDPAEAAAMLAEIDAYIQSVEDNYARAVSRRRLLTALDIIGIGLLLLVRYALKERPGENIDE